MVSQYAQHVNLCIDKYDISTEESNNEVSEIISEVTDMIVDSDSENSEDSEDSENNEDSENSENSENSEDSEDSERQESNSEMGENPQDLQDYDDDISLISLSISEKYENLPASLRSFEEEPEINLPASLQSFEEEPEIKNVKEFPSEAYADLMTLVTSGNF